MAKFNQNFPSLQQPLTGPGGLVNQSWLQFFISLWSRTGAAEAAVNAVQVQYSEQNTSSVISPVGQLAKIDSKEMLANVSAVSAIPAPVTLSTFIDAALGSTEGAVLTRTASGWVLLPPGTAQQVLTSQGAGEDLLWAAAQGVPSIADKDILANLSGVDAVPIAHTLSETFDYILGSVDGQVIFRTGGVWTVANLNTLIGTSGVGFHPGFTSGRYYSSPAHSFTNTAMAANTLYAIPFYCPFAQVFTKISANIVLTGTATLFELGIYSNLNGLPNALEYDAGSIAATSTGAREITGLSLSLSAGWHWLVVAANGTATVTACGTDNFSGFLLGYTLPNGNAVTVSAGFSATWVFSAGALPGSFPAATGISGNTPSTFLRL